MRFTSVLAAALSLACATSTPIESYSVHESRANIPQGWSKRGPLDRRTVLPVKIGLKQRNLHNAYETLMDVSHPASPNFGKHWSKERVTEHFAPSQESVDTVMLWLAKHGFGPERASVSRSKAWIKFDATVDEAEALLKTSYHFYDHDTSSIAHIASTDYSIPSHLTPHIDFVTPTLHFDVSVSGHSKKSKKRDLASAKDIGQPDAGTLPKSTGKTFGKDDIIEDLADCDQQIIPACLEALYEFKQNKTANETNSYGIVEYTPQAYLPTDLDMFFANFSPAQVGDRPTANFIDGAVLQTTDEAFAYNGESDLDLQYAMTLVYPQKITLYQVGDLVEGGSFNNFLDAIDGSYCTYEGGDDPSEDGIYPDTAAGGYKGAQDCGGNATSKVISTSYGYNEADLTPFYEERQCNEYMKLGLMGISILYSSGDDGVAGNDDVCISEVFANGTAAYNNGTSGRFNPSFPAGCPYITSVGATQVMNGTNIEEALSKGDQPEQACEEVIYSGGGFSDNFALPDYQSTAVLDWFKNYPPSYSAAQFNNSQKSRAHPDVSANGANYVVAVDGEFELVYGTSASSPVFGSILTLVNQARLNANKSSVGFINPTIYANPDVFNDVTVGTNPGCGTEGFSASAGWDPVTGLGTPNFPKLKALYLSLP